MFQRCSFVGPLGPFTIFGGGSGAPTFNAYARRYATMTRYYGVTHPSLPNYLTIASGEIGEALSKVWICAREFGDPTIEIT